MDVIVAGSPAEREGLRPFFPQTPIIVPGNVFGGRRFQSVFVTPSVDTSSLWFRERIMTLVNAGGKMFEFSERTNE